MPIDVSATVSLSVAEWTAFLEQWQVPMAPSILCARPIDIPAAASKLGFPVALKVSSRAVPHKSEVGGLRLGLANLEALTLAADEMIKTMQAAGIAIDGLQVQAMARPGALELIVGVRWDDLFGSVLMVGLGGIYAEILDDTVLGVAPLTHEDAWAMLRKLKCFPLLDGARGQVKRDVPALVDLLVDLSAHAAAAGAALREVDLNPVLVYPLGQGVTVVDALVLRVL